MDLITVLELPRDGEDLIQVPFRAEYQAENACLAALCAGLGVDKEELPSGIASASWPGRMEEIRTDVYLDGAHNPDGIRQDSDEIRRYRKRTGMALTCDRADKNHTRWSGSCAAALTLQA